MTNVIDLGAYRSGVREAAEQYPTPEELAAQPYVEICRWAWGDFDRLRAVAAARSYRPEWISHQLEESGRQMTASQAAILARMIEQAGPFLSRRERWVVRQVKAKPTCIEALAQLAKGALEYRGLKRLEIAIGHDVQKLLERGLIKIDQVGSMAVGSGERPFTLLATSSKPLSLGAANTI